MNQIKKFEKPCCIQWCITSPIIQLKQISLGIIYHQTLQHSNFVTKNKIANIRGVFIFLFIFLSCSFSFVVLSSSYLKSILLSSFFIFYWYCSVFYIHIAQFLFLHSYCSVLFFPINIAQFLQQVPLKFWTILILHLLCDGELLHHSQNWQDTWGR